ncbi:MAG: sensor histidine kinase [Gemmatimonadales bacterium]|nr:MAG: sensor histidine kinase [Gemmatimonadales bacterium]
MTPSLPDPGGANDPVGILAGTAAQEIGSALTAIQVAAERLERYHVRGGAPGSSELRVIRDQSRRLARLARNLLDLARPATRGTTPVDLGAEIRRLVPPLGRVLAREGVELRIEGLLAAEDDGGPRVRADPMRLQELVLALVANARKAVVRGPEPRWIRISAVALVDGSGEVRVADSGPGVPQGAEERIFFPIVSGLGGEGAGLSRSRLSLAGHGGGIRLGRTEQGGSEFILRLEPFEKEAP